MRRTRQPRSPISHMSHHCSLERNQSMYTRGQSLRVAFSSRKSHLLCSSLGHSYSGSALMHFHNCDRPKMNCHSDPDLAEGEESPHFARCAMVYIIGKNALLDDWHL